MRGLGLIAIKSNIQLSSIANEIGVTKQQINSWLNGSRKIPEKRLKQLESLLGEGTENINRVLTVEEELEYYRYYVSGKLGREVEILFK